MIIIVEEIVFEVPGTYIETRFFWVFSCRLAMPLTQIQNHAGANND